MTKFLLFPILTISLIFASCEPKQNKDNPTNDPLVNNIDYKVNPSEDFFLFANGKWFKEHPIPMSEQSNGLWQLIQDTINSQVKTICVTSASLQNEPKGSNKQKIGDLYASGMDSTKLNQKGISDLSQMFEQIESIKNLKDLIRVTATHHQYSGSPLLGFGVGQDERNSSKNVVGLYQSGLTLPNRNYYFDEDSRTTNIRNKFKEHTTKMFQIIGYDETKAKKATETIFKIEIDIAKTSRKKEDTRDPEKNYNKMTLAKLKESTPNLDWDIFFQTVGISSLDSVNVGQPEFFTGINKYLKSYSIDDWKNYLKLHLINSYANYLDDKTFNESFSFWSTVLRGIKEPKPRWKRVVESTNGMLGELIGQVYVQEYLPKGTKEKLLEIAKAIKTVYATRINNLDWMSSQTKVKAIKKLNSMIVKVGWPDKWKDLSKMDISRDSYAKNLMNARKWGFDFIVSKLGKPVDRTEWDMQPQTYNAYYNPSNNEIVVPGCNILIPGYEHKLADDAILYSIIAGSTFGHEMTHGFDDQGCKFDENGNLNNWWTTEDSIKFNTKTKMIVSQFNEYIAVDTLHINGNMTQGENIADLGGIMMGYEAFKQTDQYINNVKIAGLSPDQRFFLGYAFAWMVNERPESIANQVKTNEHSPPKFRVIGPLTNMPEFYKAFNIKSGDKMYRNENQRVKIW